MKKKETEPMFDDDFDLSASEWVAVGIAAVVLTIPLILLAGYGTISNLFVKKIAV